MEHADLIHKSIARCKQRIPFKVIAWTILPDHLHMVLDPGEEDLSDIMHRFKLSFSNLYRHRKNLRRSVVWQRRFWDHVIRDEADFNRHVDYIHFNAVKHGYSASPSEWPHSSYRKYVNSDPCDEEWAMQEDLDDNMSFGE